MKKFKLIVLVIIVALIAIIFWQNRQPVDFDLLFWSLNAPKTIALFITLVVGFIIGIIFCYVGSKKKKQ